MSFQESISTCFSKYADFSGRARRSEYWYFILFVLAVNTLLGVLGRGLSIDGVTNIVNGIFSLAVFVPQLSVTVRRLHDIGKSGWWYLIILVPCVGEILLIVWEVRDGDPEANQYGENPKNSFIEF